MKVLHNRRMLHARPVRGTTSTGFTMVELLTVIVIAAIILTMISAALLRAREHAKRARAETELRELIKAWGQYWTVYQQWPALSGGRTVVPGSNRLYFPMDSNNLKPLYAAGNPRKIPLLSFKGDSYMDPWGHVYWIGGLDPNDWGTTNAEAALRTTVLLPNRDRYRE